MPQRESALILEARNLIEVTDRLRADLLAYRKACERMVRSSSPGQPVTDTIKAMERINVREHRETVTEAIADFEEARHRVRLELVTRAAQDAGGNLSDVARALGVSRQLTSRLGKEARARSDKEAVPSATGAVPS